ncbi:MAG TPA: S1/P1 nuclease [Chitinophagales bacterium]|nr:S1/P1 nuclease [Chitinophagales bacterium]
MKHLQNLLLTLTFMALHNFGFAWGFAGHKISGAIAAKYITPAAKDSLAVYLGGVSMSETAAWMETVRADKTYDYLKPFHYVNVEKGKEYDTSSHGNIISELNIVMDELRNRAKYSKEHTATNLRILFDLVGDLHQPLNVGYPADRGGNNVAVTFLNRPSNLHRVWHYDIIEQYGISYESSLGKITGMPQKKLEALKPIDFIAWMNESRELLPQVYDFSNPKIDAAYCNKNKPVIEKQLAISGYRLAEILNEVFAK